MNEVHRIGRHGCLIHIKTPHKSHIESYRDPTHKHHLVTETFDYFNSRNSLSTLYNQSSFEIIGKRCLGLSFFGSLIYKLTSLRHWERHWSNIFPAKEIDVKLRIKK
jgi:hypothetical protein